MYNRISPVFAGHVAAVDSWPVPHTLEISFSPVFFALQSEIQNHRSKRGRLKSAKYYPYRSSRRKHHKAKCSDSKVQRTRGM